MARNPTMSYLTQRRVLGVLGVSLPLLVFLFNQAMGCEPLKGSISAYWFSNSRDVFTGILIAFGIFLLSYRGYGATDNGVSSAAGLAALLVAFFPALGEGRIGTPWLIAFLPGLVVSIIHYLSAITFFCLLAGMSWFLFTRTRRGTRPTRRKLARNRLYRTCGIVIWASIGLIILWKGLCFTGLLPAPLVRSVDWWRPVFWLETAALVAFGVSWLTKGEVFLRDLGSPRRR